MSKTLAVAARELRERWILFPGGLAIGFMPLVLPALGLPPKAAPTVGLLAAVLLGAIAAGVIGSSMLARDAADGRLGFLFSRPVSWPAIWGGKWLAAVVLVAGSGALAALPWMVAYPPGADSRAGSWSAALRDPQGATFFVLLLLFGVGIASFGGTLFRSRSAWVALDLAGLLASVGAFRLWVTPLVWHGVLGAFPLAGWGFLLPMVPLVVALVLATAAQTARGRTDIRRAHRAMSLAFWSVIGVTLVAAGLRLAWARAAGPSDLAAHAGSAVPSGRWLYVSGASQRGGWTTFLVDAERGRYVSRGLERPFLGLGGTGMAFSATGSTGVALQQKGDGTAILVADLTAEQPRLEVISLESTPPPDYGMRFALSASGSRILLAHANGASLFETGSGRRVATATLPPGWRPMSIRFVDESTARVWLIPALGQQVGLADDAALRILEIAVGREPRTIEAALVTPVESGRAWPGIARPDAAGRRFLTLDGGVRLRDAGTGALLATLLERPVSAVAFTADDRIVVGEAVGERTILRFYSSEGEPRGDLTLDRVGAGLGIGPPVAPGRVAVHFSSFRSGGETVVVDVSARQVVETLPGLRPLHGYWMVEARPPTPGGDVPTVHFLRREDDAIVRRDFATGEQQVVVGPGAPAGERLEFH